MLYKHEFLNTLCEVLVMFAKNEELIMHSTAENSFRESVPLMKIIPPIARAVPTRLGVELEKRCGFFISTLEEQINPNLIEAGGEGTDINDYGLGENLPMYGRRLAWGEGLNIE